MADRRMISKAIISRAKFLRLPASAQALYMHLCVHADDEGIAEGFAVIGMARGKEEDLHQLDEAGFIKILDSEELISYVIDWDKNNKIRQDRFTESMYHELLNGHLSHEPSKINAPRTFGLENEVPPRTVSLENEVPPRTISLENEVPPRTISLENEVPPHRLGKDSIGKDRLVQDRVGKNTAATRSSTNLEYTGGAVDNLQQQPLTAKLESDPEFGRVMALYQDNIHPIPNQVEADDLVDLFDEYGGLWLTQAIKEAARSQARSIKYIISILRNWKTRGVPNPWESRGKSSGVPSPQGQPQSDRVADVVHGALALIGQEA